jgi:predicted TIM-barrel fold metal-dependent hydrolase
MFESFSRRRLFTSIAAGLTGASVGTNRARAGTRQDAPQGPDKGSLLLTEFEPRSMLHVTETQVPRARFPVIDVHTHVTRRAKSAGGVSQGDAIIVSAPPRDILPAMDRRNIRIMVNLTGSSGEGLSEAIRTFQQPHPDRFVVFTEPSWDRVAESSYAAWQADELGRAKAAGARGIKVLKTLGLYVREQVTSGPLIAIDDKRFDPMWEAGGALGFPVAIHIADPEAFFLPIDRFTERYEELHAHPDWSFYGKDYPSFDALIAARDRVLARHPKTTFIGLHVGHDSENLARVGEALDKFPNLHVEIGARIGELGRQPRASRKFFDRYQDRILFGTDAVPGGTDMPQQVFGDNLYSIYFRFLETEDEYFDYAPAKIPPQGRWRIYGLGLPDDILRKVYYANAERIIGIPPSKPAD